MPESVSEQMEGFLGAIKNMIHNYKKQDGTKLRPARSCRDLKIDHPEKKDGFYFIDPNEGCSFDAQLVWCDFKENATCVYPKKSQIPKSALKDPRDGEEKWIGDDVQIDYKLDYGQLKFLRLASKTVKQNITYHCKNSKAWDSSHSMKLMTHTDEELDSSRYSPFKPKVIKNDCQMEDNQWRKTVLEIKTKKLERLPIVDVSPYDMQREFKIELGPVCFA